MSGEDNVRGLPLSAHSLMEIAKSFAPAAPDRQAEERAEERRLWDQIVVLRASGGGYMAPELRAPPQGDSLKSAIRDANRVIRARRKTFTAVAPEAAQTPPLRAVENP